MRNLSMKKFGTPTAAGPGVAIEAVGLLGVGVPLRRGRGRAGTVVTTGDWRWTTGATFLHPRPEVEPEVMQPLADWLFFLVGLRDLCRCLGAAVAAGVAVVPLVGAAVGAAAGVSVGDAITVFTGEGNGSGELVGSAVGSALAVGDGVTGGATVSVAVGVGVGSSARAWAPRRAA